MVIQPVQLSTDVFFGIEKTFKEQITVRLLFWVNFLIIIRFNNILKHCRKELNTLRSI